MGVEAFLGADAQTPEQVSAIDCQQFPFASVRCSVKCPHRLALSKFFQSILQEMLCAIVGYLLKHTSDQRTSKYGGVPLHV